MADNVLTSKYLTRQVVKQRNSVTLAKWSASEVAQPIPSPADDAWVRLRVVGESIPLSLDSTTTQTLGYFLQDPATSTNILEFISEDNDSATENSLAAQNDSIVSGFMPRYANTTVSDQQVAQWRERNDSPAPAPGVKA
jgi:hypothetical protein